MHYRDLRDIFICVSLNVLSVFECMRPWQISIIFHCYIDLQILLMSNLWDFLLLNLKVFNRLSIFKKNLHISSLVYLGFYRHLWTSLLQAYCYSFPTATILWLEKGMLRDSKCNRIHVLHTNCTVKHRMQYQSVKQ